MRLTLNIHPVREMSFGGSTRLEGEHLQVSREELRDYLLEDPHLRDVELDIVVPGDDRRIGFVYDVVEPRAKESGSGPDFPGILGPVGLVGQGATQVLRGAAVTVLDGGVPEAPQRSAQGISRVLFMNGPPGEVSPYSSLFHLVVVPHPRPELEWRSAMRALRLASVKAAVYLARAAEGHRPQTTEVFDLEGPVAGERVGLPRLIYIAQIHGHQHGTEVDEHILYGGNTVGMMPLPLHPNEWFDGALVISHSWNSGVETYFYQNNPIVTELYRRHQEGELTFAGTIVTAAASLQEEGARNCAMAAHLARWVFAADGAVLTKYSYSGAPQADMFETARLCEASDIRTVVLVSDVAWDGRVESAAVMSIPEVEAIVLNGGSDVVWHVPATSKVVAGSEAAAARIGAAQDFTALVVCGVANQQGASRLQSLVD